MKTVRVKITHGIIIPFGLSHLLYDRIDDYFRNHSCDVDGYHGFHIGLLEVLR